MTTGAVRFCRYAYAPNALGYCGPDDPRALLEAGSNGLNGPDLTQRARGFEGAWPYLSLIAGANGIDDPLDDRVVEAYWVGNQLLDRVGSGALGRFVEECFKPRLGRRWAALADAPITRSVPHHNFHVFVVYPWVGMLRLGHVVEPLRVLDRCRVRWGTVEQVERETAFVRSRPLVHDGTRLGLGEPRVEMAVVEAGGMGFVAGLVAGDVVSMHWDWVCERLDPRAAIAIRRNTVRALRAANEVLRRPAGSALD